VLKSKVWFIKSYTANQYEKQWLQNFVMIKGISLKSFVQLGRLENTMLDSDFNAFFNISLQICDLES